MPGATFTFRCGGCNRLLGASRARVGATVACPKCGRELIVPEPVDDPSPGPEVPGAGAPGASGESVLAGQPAAGTPAWARGEEPRSEPPAGFPVVEIETEPFSLRPRESSRPHRIPNRSWSDPGSATGSSDLPQVETAPEPLRSGASGLYETRSAARRNDVVLPRTAFLLWSFAMLVALVFAFVAGALAGHFLWPSPTASPTAAPARAAGGR